MFAEFNTPNAPAELLAAAMAAAHFDTAIFTQQRTA
jgi:hypothetical protein